MEPSVEILAPAGNFESFLAAVHAGADAVYLGGTLFSARASAQNFSKEQLLEALDYAHLHGRKVYLAVNTLLKEEELKQLPDYLLPYYLHGLDAVIVQDMGVLKTVSEYFPRLPIHLSTQMTLTGGMGASLLEQEPYRKFSVTRLVPARELSLEEIRLLRKETNLELEVFVHGALCVCYSGRCFLSSRIGGRSGNRGQCAQPCRKLYTDVETGASCYALSPKDLCALELIPDLIEAGIDSFKIEGRMKKPAYTAFLSYVYKKYAVRFTKYGRKEYEAYLRKHPQELEDDLRGMKDIYNRGGFTKGYFINKNGRDMMAVKRPGHEGLFAGTVEAVGKRDVEIRWKQEIFHGDVLEIRHDGRQVYEYTSGTDQKPGEKSSVHYLPGIRIEKGMAVYRTRNQRLLSEIEETLIKPEPKKRLRGCFFAETGKPISLTLEDTEESGVSVTVYGNVCEKAQKQPITETSVYRQLSRLGNTDFAWEKLELRLSPDIFLPVREINELRRQGLESWKREYLKKFYRTWKEKPEKDWSDGAGFQAALTDGVCPDSQEQGFPEIAVELLTTEQWRETLSFDRVSVIYARMELLENQELLSLAEETKKKGKRCGLSFPQILRSADREKVRELLSALLERKLCDAVLLHDLEQLAYVIREWGGQADFPELVADSTMYSMNSQAVRVWKQFGCRRVTASIEQDWREWAKLPLKGEEILVYGRLPLMVSAQCLAGYGRQKDCIGKPVQTILSDQWKEKFYARNYCRFCYNILYSEIYHCPAEKDRLSKLSFAVWRYSFTDETKQEVNRVLSSLENF